MGFVLIESQNSLGLEKEKSDSSFLVKLSQIEMLEIPTMEIVVLLRTSVARAFQGKPADRELADPAEIQAVLDRFGAEMRPQHPGVTDPKLGSYFTIHGVSSSQVDEFLSALRHLNAVEAAYTKPFAAPP
ncbi:hypothetical protein N825_36050 [Skermanella stibiiresistens SB22]|uniref:Uncharacterized protein n=2 Tax=Skermanella TaxID=204447 RepID=W9GPR5_9PROT|nr:hypothetical protein N825_36050 [Skermanella stibiiresistens SB22]